MPVVLKEVTLEGFKSFAEETALALDTPVVAIVGPNGSGKSNIAEAIRFALGEQSMRSLRSGRGEDVIFNGSPGRPRANRARVELVFDNTKRVFPLDIDEVRVARTVVRDGAQEYEINGSRVRLRDVQELVAHANLGPSGYHVISQGEADRLIGLSPTALRAVVEDALGLRLHHTRRAQALAKIASAREALREAYGRKAELEPRLATLKTRLAKVRKGKELAQALGAAWEEYSRAFWAWLQAQQRELEEEANRLARELENARAQAAAGAAEGREDPVAAARAARESLRAAQEAYRAREKEARLVGERLARAQGALEALRLEEKEEGPAGEEGVVVTVPRAELTHLSRALEEAAAFLDQGETAHARAELARAREILRAWEARARRPADSDGENSREERRRARLVALQRELAELEAQQEAAVRELERARVALSEAQAAFEAAQQQLRAYDHAQFRAREAERTYEFSLRALEERKRSLERSRELWEEDAREVALLLQDPRLLEAPQEVGPASWDEAALARRRKEIERMKLRLEELARLPAAAIEEEYQELSQRHEALTRDIADLEETQRNLEAMIREIDKELTERFAAGVREVSRSFDGMVRTIFGQGSGSLEIVEAAGREEETAKEEATIGGFSPHAATARFGVEVRVTLPRKRLSHLGMLSGGERSLVAVALVFALTRISPPPFLVLDEADAALDEANSQRFGALLEEMANATQLIVITHNRETMRHAQRLYGVAMGPDGVSRILSVRLEEAARAGGEKDA